MINDIPTGTVFELGPQTLEFKEALNERIGVAYLLTPDCERQYDDTKGEEVTVCFSDVRFNDQYPDGLEYEDLT